MAQKPTPGLQNKETTVLQKQKKRNTKAAKPRNAENDELPTGANYCGEKENGQRRKEKPNAEP